MPWGAGGGQRPTFRSQFSPSIMGGLGIELKGSAFIEGRPLYLGSHFIGLRLSIFEEGKGCFLPTNHPCYQLHTEYTLQAFPDFRKLPDPCLELEV